MKRVSLFLIIGLSLLAVEVRTNIPLVYHEGSHELIGSFTLVFSDNDFPNATPQNPVYIRFRLLQANGWSKSLVDLRPGAPAAINQPINIALYPSGNSITNPALPADAVQLVRVIQGEKEGWLRINRSSALWAFRNGIPTSPSVEGPIGLTVGISGYASVRPDTNTVTGGNEYADGSSVATTELCANYENTLNFNPGDLEYIDFVSYLADTTGVETAFTVVPGTNSGVTFSNDNQIARGELYVARLEYHLQPDSYDNPPHQLELSRIDAVDLWNLCQDIPTVYLTNASDFAWEPGTVIYLCMADFTPAWIGSFAPYSASDEVFLSQSSSPRISSAFSAKWQIDPIIHKGVFAGYSFKLIQGSHPAHGAIAVDGLRSCLNNEIPEATLNLAAYASVLNNFVTDGEKVELGPRIRATAKMQQVNKPAYRTVIPYTAYDKKDWNCLTTFVNNSGKKATLSAFLYNRYGIELRLWSQKKLEPRASIQLDIEQEFGALAKTVLAWVEVLSDQPIAAISRLEDDDKQMLDYFSGVQEFKSILIAPHVPSRPELWGATGYIVSSNLIDEAEYFVKYPGSEDSRIRSILVPGSTAVIREQDFEAGRPGWFQVSTDKPAGSGLLIYNKLTGPGQLASVPMEHGADTQWTFDHLGNTFAGWWNGLVLVNPQMISISVTLSAYDAEHRLLNVQDVEVAPDSRTVDVVENLMPGLAGISPSRLEIESEYPIVSMLLIGIDNLDILTSIPGKQATSTQLLMPYISPDPNDWHGMALVNPNDKSALVKLTPYTALGVAGPETTLAMPADGKTVWLLEELFPSLRSYRSLRIESTRPVRGIVLTGNNARTQLATIKLVP
ncbi:MAG: hypothetical protein H6510_09005 [Acidobacteria bacterium]|nr:hypothetical protein [Acidobacteriota bacterium]MCB9397942.1 hypothetical protein [Acidobacteriota bacterium]